VTTTSGDHVSLAFFLTLLGLARMSGNCELLYNRYRCTVMPPNPGGRKLASCAGRAHDLVETASFVAFTASETEVFIASPASAAGAAMGRAFSRPPMYQYWAKRASWMLCAVKLVAWQAKRR
jgi:hypothetical protein